MRPTFRARKLDEVSRAYDAFLAGGFPVTYAGQAETLQCRRNVDETSWLYLQSKCERASVAGYGAELIPEPGIRCTSNRFIRPTVDETLAILTDLGIWAEAAQANNWRMKDAVRDAESGEALNAIELGEGWP